MEARNTTGCDRAEIHDAGEFDAIGNYSWQVCRWVGTPGPHDSARSGPALRNCVKAMDGDVLRLVPGIGR
jgi:hypothetical protein